MIRDLQEALARTRDDGDSVALVDLVEEMLGEPNYVQALALAARMTNTRWLSIAVGPFDLPKGYWLVDFEGGQHKGGFTCGISPEGEVSS